MALKLAISASVCPPRRPAAEKNTGATAASPRPQAARPANMVPVVAPTTASTRPAPHSSEPAPITATGPKRVTTASVRKRPTAIVAANTANAMPATLSLACRP